MSLPLPIQAACSGSGSRELRMTLGVPSIRVSSGTQFQLDCDCSVWRTCRQASGVDSCLPEMLVCSLGADSILNHVGVQLTLEVWQHHAT